MLNITPLTSQGKNGEGADILAYLKATEYYIGDDGQSKSMSSWWGGGAASLGLLGKPVDVEEMSQLAKGFSPDGKALCESAGRQPEITIGKDGKEKIKEGHRVGYDATFNAPSSVSTTFALADDAERQAILKAQDAAVNAGLKFLQDQAITRRGKGGIINEHAELVVSKHCHLANRDLEEHVHTHALIYSVVKGADGKWSSIEGGESLFSDDTVKAAGAVYRAQLAYEMRKLGYGIEQTVGRDLDGERNNKDTFEITGISEEFRMAFSSRRKAILEYMAEHGGTAQQACLATRRHKDEPSFDEMSKMWKQAKEAYAAQGNAVPTIEQLKQQGQSKVYARAGHERRTRNELKRDLHENEAVLSRNNVTKAMATERVGELSADDILNETSQWLKSKDFVPLNARAMKTRSGFKKTGFRTDQVRYATKEYLAMEQELLQRTTDSLTDERWTIAPSVAAKAIEDYESKKGFTLSDEQRAMVHWAVDGTKGVAALIGRAGTGKTTVAECYIAAFEGAGKTVIGSAPSWTAAQKLAAETGKECYSNDKLLSMLDKGEIRLTGDTVLLVDEAGMTGNETMLRLKRHADHAGSKMVLTGDALQLQPIAAGSALRLMEEKAGSAELKEIRRQKWVSGRKMANLHYADGKTPGEGERTAEERQALGKAIFEALEADGCIAEFETKTEAVKQLVADYFADQKPFAEKLVIAGTRNEVAQLNREIREGYKQRGVVKSGAEEEHRITMNVQGHAVTADYSCGDIVQFTKRQKGLNVVNGDQARIDHIRRMQDGRWQVQAHVLSGMSKGQNRTFVVDGSKDLPTFVHAYAMTVHKSQGQGMDSVFHLVNKGMLDQHSALVGFTRSKQSFKSYGSILDFADIESRYALDRVKRNAVEIGVAPSPKVIDLAERQAQRTVALRQKLQQGFEKMHEAVKQRVAALQGARPLKRQQTRSIGG